MPIPALGQRRRGRPPKGTRGDTRQDLLDAALRLFSRQGYAATSVREIADEVGIRDSAIYAHFESKAEMLEALVEEAGPYCIDEIGYDFSRLADRPPDKALPEFFEHLIDAWDEPRRRQLVSLLAREGFANVQDIVGDVQDRFSVHLRAWVRAGHLRRDVTIEQLVWELITPLAAIRILHFNAESTPAVRSTGRRLARRHVRYFLTTAAAGS